MIRSVLLLSALLLDPAAAAAFPLVRGERPQVAVRFELAEPNYTDAFIQVRGPDGEVSELEQFQADVTELLCAALKERVGLVDFFVDSQETVSIEAVGSAGAGVRPLVLGVRLTSLQQALSDLRPTFLSLTLDGLPPGELPSPLKWEFRTPQDYSRAIVRDRFAQEIRTCLERRLDARLDELVARMLCRISIAREIYFLRNEERARCVLPYTYGELKAGIGTRFLIEVERPGSVFNDVAATPVSSVRNLPLSGLELPPSFQRGIQAVSAHRIQPPAPDAMTWTPLESLAEASGRISVQRLCVLEYRFVPPVPAARPGNFERMR